MTGKTPMVEPNTNVNNASLSPSPPSQQPLSQGNHPPLRHPHPHPHPHPQSSSAHSSQHSNTSRLQPSPIPPPTASSQSSHSHRDHLRDPRDRDRDRDDQLDGTTAVRKSHSYSISSNPLTVASSSKSSSAADRRDALRGNVRTLPPWVQAAADDDSHESPPADATSLLLPRTPVSARPPSRNFMPTPKSNVPGRKFDHAREGAPVTMTGPMHDQASKWSQFTKSIEGDAVRTSSSRGQIVDDAWMRENMPDLEEPWQPMDQESKEKETGFWLFSKHKRSRYHRALMDHPMVPLAVRMTVLTFSVTALALASAIFHKSDNASCKNNSSTWMAILVDVVAIVYTIYITYDEYTSRPLGLRSHNAKMRLIFLDLAFIVFDSANLSLAFQALTDEQWACQSGRNLAENMQNCPYIQDICVRQKALTATLLVALVAWLMTFAISTLRLLERVAR